MNKVDEKIDFKKCPFCGSEKVCAVKSHPDYDHVGDQYHEPCECGECRKEWTTIYKPYRNESDDLTAQALLYRLHPTITQKGREGKKKKSRVK